MPKISVIHFHKDSSGDYDSYGEILTVLGITDWVEVTDKELYLLRDYYHSSRSGGHFALIEQQNKVQIDKTIRECLERAKAKQLAEEAEKARKAEAKLKASLKKKAKDEAAEKKLLEELLKKHQQTGSK